MSDTMTTIETFKLAMKVFDKIGPEGMDAWLGLRRNAKTGNVWREPVDYSGDRCANCTQPTYGISAYAPLCGSCGRKAGKVGM